MSEGYKVLTVEDQTLNVSQNTSFDSAVVATPKKRQKVQAVHPRPMVNRSIVLSAKFATKVRSISRQIVIV